ncbi:TonB-dependent receptor [Thalassomonas sp. RHCl1]|uniref:TonB-dependent receptor n=1 Tax=Thalassomonas sp. RHCl1 TaxID=2995320 RepID=UPI00248BA266|nr:TonB-dependent receptor [Thalassomonas sp. RHCl1]
MNSKQSVFKKSLLATSISSCFLAAMSISAVAQAEESAVAEKSAAAKQTKEVEVIEVVGTRAAWAKSLLTKKDSDVIMESINATDIGKMPDANVAESLQRLTGIQISRNNGEGSNIQIRGMSKNLLLLNDEVMLTGQGQTEGGMASLEEIPSELIGEVQVFKAARADLIEGGMGGTVNIITRKPLQLEDFTLAGNLKSGWGENSSTDIEPSGALVIGNNWDDKYGFLLSVSSSERYKESDYALTERQPYANIAGQAPWRVDVLEDGARVDYPEIYAPSQSIEQRKRIGSALALQYRPMENLDLSFDWVHNELQNDTESVKALFHMDRPSENLLAPGVEHTGRVIDNARFTLKRQENQTNVTDQTNEADNFKFQADWVVSDNFRAVLNVSKADAHEKSLYVSADTMSTQNSRIARNAEQAANPALRELLNPNGIESFDMWYSDTGVGQPDIRIDHDLGNADYHYFKSAWAGGGERDSESDAIKLDFEYDIDLGPLRMLSAGVRVANRDVKFQGFEYAVDYTNRGATSGDTWGPLYRYQDAGITDPGLGYTILDPVRFADDPTRVTIYKDFYGLKDQYGESMDLAAISTDGMRNPHAWMSDYTGSPVQRVNDPKNKWSVDQEVKSIYLMADFEADVFGDMFLTANLGARYVQTKILVKQQTSLPDTPTRASYDWNGVLDESGFIATPLKNDFNDFLPSFSANLEIADDMFVKFAASKTMARQNLNDLAAAFNKSYSNEVINNPDGSTTEIQNFIGGSRGNPELKPDRTTAYDLSYEWYFGDESLFSAAVFYKDMTSVVIQEQKDEAHFNGDGVTLNTAPVTSYFNTGGGTVEGVELGLQHVFDNGFGFNTNYTYSNGEAKDDVDEDGTSQLPLQNLSEHSANLGVFYDNDGLRANVSYNWRSEFIIGYTTYHSSNQDLAPRTPIYSDSYGQVDASIGYEVNESFTILAEVTNLFGEDTNQYLGTDASDQFWNYYQGEARYYLGVAFKM